MCLQIYASETIYACSCFTRCHWCGRHADGNTGHPAYNPRAPYPGSADTGVHCKSVSEWSWIHPKMTRQNSKSLKFRNVSPRRMCVCDERPGNFSWPTQTCSKDWWHAQMQQWGPEQERHSDPALEAGAAMQDFLHFTVFLCCHRGKNTPTTVQDHLQCDSFHALEKLAAISLTLPLSSVSCQVGSSESKEVTLVTKSN